MIVVSPCSCLWPIHWSHVLSWEWRCSWSSADRRCSNYIWMINNFIAKLGVSYIRGLTVHTTNMIKLILARNKPKTYIMILHLTIWICFKLCLLGRICTEEMLQVSNFYPIRKKMSHYVMFHRNYVLYEALTYSYFLFLSEWKVFCLNQVNSFTMPMMACSLHCQVISRDNNDHITYMAIFFSSVIITLGIWKWKICIRKKYK